MAHRLVLLNDSLTIRLDGKVDSQELAQELRTVLDNLHNITTVVLDFTHAAELDQNFKATMYRQLQHPKLARVIGACGINPGVFKDAKELLLGLAHVRKVIVRDTEVDLRGVLNLTPLPKGRGFTGMLSFVKKDGSDATSASNK
jgi:hypothetical protein